MTQATPKLVYDNQGLLIEVILSADDYRAYLSTLAHDADWETLPAHLQDAVDLFLVDEVRSQERDAPGIALEDLLADAE